MERCATATGFSNARGKGDCRLEVTSAPGPIPFSSRVSGHFPAHGELGEVALFPTLRGFLLRCRLQQVRQGSNRERIAERDEVRPLAGII